jgi:hypothetical protein
VVCEAIGKIAIRGVAPFYSLGAGLGKRAAKRISPLSAEAARVRI